MVEHRDCGLDICFWDVSDTTGYGRGGFGIESVYDTATNRHQPTIYRIK